MDTIRRAAIEIVILAIVAVGLGFTANGVRAKGSVDLEKNYFSVGWEIVNEKAKEPTLRAEVSGPRQEADESQSHQSLAAPPTPCDKRGADPDHPYQVISFEEVVAAFNDPKTAMGANVFIDARSAAVYEDGHIPCAVQVDAYEVADCLDNVLDCISGAEKVIVYCNGGDCEDSVFLCRDLINADVPYETIYLYPGGCQEWEEKGMPMAMEGGEEE
jgi:rhodanese-related sulfurtransferase